MWLRFCNIGALLEDNPAAVQKIATERTPRKLRDSTVAGKEPIASGRSEELRLQ